MGVSSRGSSRTLLDASCAGSSEGADDTAPDCAEAATGVRKITMVTPSVCNLLIDDATSGAWRRDEMFVPAALRNRFQFMVAHKRVLSVLGVLCSLAACGGPVDKGPDERQIPPSTGGESVEHGE